MKDGKVFYAGIHDPRTLRKDVLLCQKAILDSLRKYEHIRALRMEKEIRVLELRKMLAGLKAIANQMRSALPAGPIKQKAPVAMKAATPTARKEAVQRKTKMQVLEDELAKIEHKLSSIE